MNLQPKTAARALAASLLVSAAALSGAAEADNIPFLPQPLSGLGSLPWPVSFILPNYKTVVPPNSWTGFYVSPQIGYQGAQFTGNAGDRLRSAHGITLG